MKEEGEAFCLVFLKTFLNVFTDLEKWTKKNNSLTLTVSFYHVTYAFQSEPKLYSCLNVKEVVARNGCDIWLLSDCKGVWTHNH